MDGIILYVIQYQSIEELEKEIQTLFMEKEISIPAI